MNRAVDRPSPVREYRTDRRLWRFAGKGALFGLIVGAVLSALDTAAELYQPVLLLLIAPTLVAITIQLVRYGVADVPPPVPVPVPAETSADYFAGLRHLERRLEAGSKDPVEFEWSIRPVLAELAIARLGLRHDCRIHAEPDRAREIVGEELWEIMTVSPDRPIRSMSRDRLLRLVSLIAAL